MERHRLRTSDAERDQGVSRKPSLHLIRESRIASSPWAVSRTGFASGTAGSLNVAVASAGWRSLEAGAIVRGASSNAISAVCALSDLIIPTPYCGWRTFLPIWRRFDVQVALELCETVIESATVVAVLPLQR